MEDLALDELSYINSTTANLPNVIFSQNLNSHKLRTGSKKFIDGIHDFGLDYIFLKNYLKYGTVLKAKSAYLKY